MVGEDNLLLHTMKENAKGEGMESWQERGDKVHNNLQINNGHMVCYMMPKSWIHNSFKILLIEREAVLVPVNFKHQSGL